MSIVNCPKCGLNFDVELYFGNKIKCVRCSEWWTV